MIRWAAIGAVLGFAVSLALTLVMPVRYTATVVVAASGSHAPSLTRAAAYTPPAQLYGALGPGEAPGTLTFIATAPTRSLALARVAAALPGGHGRRVSASVVHSPHMLRDLLLGLVAGALMALALNCVRPMPTPRRWRGSSSW